MPAPAPAISFRPGLGPEGGLVQPTKPKVLDSAYSDGGAGVTREGGCLGAGFEIQN